MSWVLDRQELHITAGAMPQVRVEGEVKNFDLRNELQMVKAALLYGDHTKLCSFAPASLFDIAAMTDLPQDKRLDFLQQAATWQTLDESMKEKIAVIVEEYEYAKSRRHSKRGRLMLRQLDAQLEENWGLAKQKVEEIIFEAGGQGIVEAVRLGLLDVHTFGGFFSDGRGK